MKLKGYSLIEVVVSMTLASIIFSVGLMIYLNVTQSLGSNYRKRLFKEAKFYQDSLMVLGPSSAELPFVDDQGLTIDLVIESFDEDFPQMYWVTTFVTDSLELNGTYRRLYYLPDHEE